MRILTLSNCPLVETQGSGYVTLNFCEGLRRRGHEVDVYAPEDYELCPTWRKAGAYRRAIGILKFVRDKVNSKPYDIVEFYCGESWLAASVLSKLPKRKFLLVSHSNGLETHFRENLNKHIGNVAPDGCSPRKWYHFNQQALYARAFTHVDGVVTVSDFDCQFALANKYGDAEHVVAINNPLPDDYLGIETNFKRQSVVGYCGSWLACKGTDIIVNDMKRVLTEFPQCKFVLIGVGADFHKEKYFGGELHERIEIVSFVESKQRLRELYESLAILVAPSIYESFGLVVTEAMACGVAVVATKVGFAYGLQHEEEVMLLQEPHSPLLYEAVKRLLDDEPLRLRIAVCGYNLVQSLHWSLAVARLESVYQDWLYEFKRSSGHTTSY
ncbi:MAG: glycosyltransferase family 4 protein [Pyrinomonadaceae bacterium MAG19_C2-C3]|nr:glycosyltransferase family 4 protein [Pyrinomonadaceae bacterium MAG19_C2-C3]